MTQILLASSSKTRLGLLRAAGLDVISHAPHLDEPAIRAALMAEGATPRDIAGYLAQMKAEKIAMRYPDALVLGCDQVLEFDQKPWGKAKDLDELYRQLWLFRGKTHYLLSAIVLYENGVEVWRHVGRACLTMRLFSKNWLEGYIARNWDDIRHCAGGYLLEKEGVRLFKQVEGDYFTILGLPMFELLAYLELRGHIET